MRQKIYLGSDWQSDRGEDTYIENYSLRDAMLYAGAAREPDILKTITHDCLERRCNCSMIFRREGELLRSTKH